MRHPLLLLAALSLLAAAAPVPVPAPEQQADVKRVETYLSGITSIVADFTQVDARGGTADGKFYLKRPGKMRWEYKPPTPILLVSNGKVMTYYDSELDQVNYIPFDDTLAGFIAQPTITLNSASTTLTEFTSQDNVIRATLVQKSKPTEGSLTLEFSDAPLQLRKMVVTDAAGAQTRIELQNASFGPVLPDSLFKFEDPRGINPRRRK